LRRRFDVSDLVQDALLKAHQNLGRFQGLTEAELVKWLQEVLANAAIDRVRRETAGKRDVALERSLQDAVAGSSARLETFLVADQPSPSEQVERQERLLKIAAAIDQLPEDQQDVVILRDLMDASVRQIAEQLGRTEKSVAGLLLRGRGKLRALLADCQSDLHG
jgi:RNA polymerase sigma-70 factor (ECF subfamily)